MSSEKFDVVVIGGGTAGSVAGIASAREGVKTLIIEQYGFLGGSATGALVTPLMRWNEDDYLVGGISDEINKKMELLGYQEGPFFDPEMLKYVLEEMAVESGANLLYYTYVRDVIMEGHKLIGVVVQNKSGIQEVYGDIFIDATGDGDVAVMAGAPFKQGREEDGLNQAMSLRFIVGHIDLERFRMFLSDLGYEDGQLYPFLEGSMLWGRKDKLEPIFRRAVEDGILLEEDGDYFQFFFVPGKPDQLAFNCPRISGRYSTDVKDLTFAQIYGKKAIIRLITFFRKYFPGFEESYITSTAVMVGVRESRRIVGEYMLTYEDVIEGRKFPDAVAKNAYPVDIHKPKPDRIKPSTLLVGVKPGDYYEIPYRCLIPKNIDNLIVTGRCISATFEAQASLRIQVICRKLGEAAGIAGSMCVKEKKNPREINVLELKKRLIWR